MGDKPLFKSFFSDAEVVESEYQRELAKLAEGRHFMKAYDFDPSLPFESGYNTYSKVAISAAFKENPPTQTEMANAIGVPLDTLKGWLAPKSSKKHRAVHTEQFAMIVSAGVAHAHLRDTPEARTKVACGMLGTRTPKERERDAKEREDGTRRTKVRAIALRTAALDAESLELMLDLSERLLATSTTAGGFDWWGNECVEYMFSSHCEKWPDIEDGEHECIDRTEYFELVKDAVRDADVDLIDELWQAQPYESPLNDMW